MSTREQGFTYLAALFAVALLSGGLALAGEVWETSAKRDKEAELLYVGNQYRKAIERYFLSGQQQYPRSLEDLLKDRRRPGTVRYLRKRYPDPLTGKEWGLVKAPDGGILGVHSLSEERPLKVAGFRPRDAAFEGAQKYSEWKFTYALPVPSIKPAPKPATK